MMCCRRPARMQKSLIISYSIYHLSQGKMNLFLNNTLPITVRPLSNTTETTIIEKPQPPSKPSKDSLILENFRQRKLRGSSVANATQQAIASSSGVERANINKRKLESGDHTKSSGPTYVLASFEELGLREELIDGARLMGLRVPTEIQCVGISAVLEGKSVILSSDPGPARTLAYMLPLLQLLQQEAAFSTVKPNHPRAIVLCPTEELSDEVFRMAKLISDAAWSKASRIKGSGQCHQEVVSNAPIGMLIGTPDEVMQQMEDGSILIEDVKYLALDEADTTLDHTIYPQVGSILSALKNRESESNNQGCQTVLVTSTLTKFLGKKFSPIMERLEHDNAGKVAAMLLEMDQREVFDNIKSIDSLKRKVTELVNSIMPGT